jgi:hypothetical protein
LSGWNAMWRGPSPAGTGIFPVATNASSVSGNTEQDVTTEICGEQRPACPVEHAAVGVWSCLAGDDRSMSFMSKCQGNTKGNPFRVQGTYGKNAGTITGQGKRPAIGEDGYVADRCSGNRGSPQKRQRAVSVGSDSRPPWLVPFLVVSFTHYNRFPWNARNDGLTE